MKYTLFAIVFTCTVYVRAQLTLLYRGMWVIRDNYWNLMLDMCIFNITIYNNCELVENRSFEFRLAIIFQFSVIIAKQ